MFNYRIIKQKDLMGSVFYAVYGVYYNCAGVPDNWHKEPTYPVGYTLKELKSDYRDISEAFNRPVLELINDELVKCK